MRRWAVTARVPDLWLIVRVTSGYMLHVQHGLVLNPWFCMWILYFQNVTLRAVLITALLFFIYLWVVILLQSVLFQSMKA